MLPSGISLRSRVRYLALNKAEASREGYKGLVLSADTIVYVKKTIFEKPRSVSEAREMLSQMSGRTHGVISACCIYDTVEGRSYTRSEVSSVTFRRLSSDEIDEYLEKRRPLDCAGSYNIATIPRSFLSFFEGCQYSVMGLPVKSLMKLLKSYTIVDQS